MVKSRRLYGGSFKAKVALEAIREKKTIIQLASPFGIPPDLVIRWRKEMLAGAAANRQEFRDKKKVPHGNIKPVGFGSGILEILPNPDSLNSVSKKSGPV